MCKSPSVYMVRTVYLAYNGTASLVLGIFVKHFYRFLCKCWSTYEYIFCIVHFPVRKTETHSRLYNDAFSTGILQYKISGNRIVYCSNTNFGALQS